uniref:Uncharacterized protein n=1 Tax=Plectus sambesii TaxID=2011161 RepID=A0A914WIU9_9BILA
MARAFAQNCPRSCCDHPKAGGRFTIANRDEQNRHVRSRRRLVEPPLRRPAPFTHTTHTDTYALRTRGCARAADVFDVDRLGFRAAESSQSGERAADDRHRPPPDTTSQPLARVQDNDKVCRQSTQPIDHARGGSNGS